MSDQPAPTALPAPDYDLMLAEMQEMDSQRLYAVNRAAQARADHAKLLRIAKQIETERNTLATEVDRLRAENYALKATVETQRERIAVLAPAGETEPEPGPRLN